MSTSSTQRASSTGHDVALYGITGALGREVLHALEVEHEGIARFVPVAGTRSAGTQARWRGASLTVLGPGEADPGSIDFAILATPSDAASREAPRLLDAGARVLDASGALSNPPLPRALPAPAPLAWPGLSTFKTVDLELETALTLPSAAVSTLAPLIDALLVAQELGSLPRLVGIDATALLSASQAGRGGVEALSRQAVGLLNYRPILDPRPFPAVLAFNTIAPSADETVLFEARAMSELKRLFAGLDQVRLELQPLWIPAFAGIALSVSLRFEAAVDPAAFLRVVTAHPELTLGAPTEAAPGEPEADDDLVEPDGVEPDAAPDGAETDDGEANVDPDAASLRAMLERRDVLVSTPLFGADGSVRVVLMADPIERTAQAITTLLLRWMETLDAE